MLTLYDGDEMKAITENYVVKWGRQGLARDLDQFDNHRVLFTVRNTHAQSIIASIANYWISYDWFVCLFVLFVSIIGFEQSRFE